MGHKISIDFGTTNSVVAQWKDGVAEFITLPDLGARSSDNHPAIIPSLLYVNDGRAPRVTVGQAVRNQQLDRQRNNRLFRNFKRGIVLWTDVEPRLVDGVAWSEREVGKLFLQELVHALPCKCDEIEQLVLTVPVTAFDSYVTWLSELMGEFVPEVIRVLDESTAAALGYAVTEPEALALVFDFGGGTLDLALVQLPPSREKTGGMLSRLLGQEAQTHKAKVIAKAGQVIGGSDIDQWLLTEILVRIKLSIEELGQDYAALLSVCEQAKIDLSTQDSTTMTFEAGGQAHVISLSRAELESILERNGFYTAVQRAIDKVMHVAHRRGVFREDLNDVLMVGGTSLMPSLQTLLKKYFRDATVRCDKPFTAIAEGALQIAAGLGLEDYLAHSYGLRYRDASGALQYDEIIPQGSRYPLETPIEVYLCPSQPDQSEIEFVVGAIDLGAVSMVEVKYEGEQAVLVAQAKEGGAQVIALNGEAPIKVPLANGGIPDEERLVARFTVDALRTLRLTVRDIKTNQTVLDHHAITLLSDHPTESPASPESFYAPTLVARRAPQQYRLSLRGLATMLDGVLPPESVSLDVLAVALQSNEFYARYAAAEMLSKRGDREARLILESVLAHGRAPQRASAVHHVHRFSWFVAEPLLRQALNDADARVHESAMYALCRMRDASAYQLMTDALPKENDDVRMAVAWGICSMPDARAVPALAIALNATEADVRVKVLEALAATESPSAIPIVRAALHDPDLDVKYAAMLSLIELQGDAALPESAALIKTERGAARQYFLRAFFHATNYRHIDVARSEHSNCVIESLDVAMRDELPEVRVMASLPLAWIRHERASAILLEAYHRERDADVKINILRNAVHLMSLAKEALLHEAMHGTDETMRAAAESILREKPIGWSDLASLNK